MFYPAPSGETRVGQWMSAAAASECQRQRRRRGSRRVSATQAYERVYLRVCGAERTSGGGYGTGGMRERAGGGGGKTDRGSRDARRGRCAQCVRWVNASFRGSGFLFQALAIDVLPRALPLLLCSVISCRRRKLLPRGATPGQSLLHVTRSLTLTHIHTHFGMCRPA
jgi:hypothetical protein